MSLVLHWLTAILMLLGALLALLAAVGLLRFPDTFLRMQATAKASTLGLACLIIGAALQLTDVSSVVRLCSIGAFIMLTAPLSAHVVARSALHRGTALWAGTALNEYDARECLPDSERPLERSEDLHAGGEEGPRAGS